MVVACDSNMIPSCLSLFLEYSSTERLYGIPSWYSYGHVLIVSACRRDSTDSTLICILLINVAILLLLLLLLLSGETLACLILSTGTRGLVIIALKEGILFRPTATHAHTQTHPQYTGLFYLCFCGCIYLFDNGHVCDEITQLNLIYKLTTIHTCSYYLV